MVTLLKKHRHKIRLSLSMCAHCSLCAESCFKYRNSKNDPSYTPSYKFINSLGKLYRKKGRVPRAELESMRELVWEKCALCMRCYCPLGVSVPGLIALARAALRSQGIFRDYAEQRDETTVVVRKE
jgi:Fe-S oxidoreductase